MCGKVVGRSAGWIIGVCVLGPDYSYCISAWTRKVRNTLTGTTIESLSAMKLLELTGADFEGLVVYGSSVMSGNQGMV
jgi:hypothetical protein